MSSTARSPLSQRPVPASDVEWYERYTRYTPAADAATRPIADTATRPPAPWREKRPSPDFPSTQMSSSWAPVVYLLGDAATTPIQIPAGVSLVNVGVERWGELLALVCPARFARDPTLATASKTLIPSSTKSFPGRNRSSPSHQRIKCQQVATRSPGLFSLWARRVAARHVALPAHRSKSHAAASQTTPPSLSSSASNCLRIVLVQTFWAT